MSTTKDIALKYVGVREGTPQHKKIIDAYNSIRPLPRGYKVKYTDPWCAAFASVCMTKAGVTSFSECSVPRMYDKIKQAGRVTKTPAVGDLVFYQWDGGTLDHVGIVSEIDKGWLEVIEGNFHDAVGIRRVRIESSSVYCFGTLKQKTGKASPAPSVVLDVIRGKYGNGADRVKRLTDAGYDAAEVQEAVNLYLSK